MDITQVCAFIVLIVVGLFLLLLAYGAISGHLGEKRIRSRGRRVKAWIVVADPTLYKVYNVAGYSHAQVVFSRTGSEDEQVRFVAEKLKTLFEGNDSVALKVFEKLHRLDPPRKIPASISENQDLYFADVLVYWKMLPGKRLRLPYIYADALVGEGGGVLFVEYPEDTQFPPDDAG